VENENIETILGMYGHQIITKEKTVVPINDQIGS
jgi:hypothetical protein